VRQAAGLAAETLPYGELGVVANLACEKPHRNTAFQWFRADGVLAWLPLPENRLSMVWSTPEAHGRELLALAPAAFCARVAAAGGHRLGALELITPAAGFPLRLMRLPRIVAPRLALIGDAAHAIHPLSGHGINLGFLDAQALAGALLALPEFRDCGEERVLRRYERARAEEVALLQWTTHGLQRLFRPRYAGLAALRNLGLNLTNRLPLVRNALVRYALG
jgi:ubiquinone biosynthesis UbiH/UbiF/VisC/COQ6 family hydroxylase